MELVLGRQQVEEEVQNIIYKQQVEQDVNTTIGIMEHI